MPSNNDEDDEDVASLRVAEHRQRVAVDRTPGNDAETGKHTRAQEGT